VAGLAEAGRLPVAAELDPPGPELLHRRLEVVAHEAQLVPRLLAGVHAELCGREREDQPAVVGVDVVPSEDVAKDGAERLGFRRVEEGVDAGDRHPRSPGVGRTGGPGYAVAGP